MSHRQSTNESVEGETRADITEGKRLMEETSRIGCTPALVRRVEGGRRRMRIPGARPEAAVTLLVPSASFRKSEFFQLRYAPVREPS